MKSTLLVFFAFLVCIQCDQVRDRCQQQSGVSDAILDKLYHRVVEDDPKLKTFLLCSNKMKGIQNEKGEISLEGVRKEISNGPRKLGVIEDQIVNCAKDKETPEETAWAFAKCLTGLINTKV